MSTLPDGRMYVLPVFWQVETKRWLDWKETTPIPDGAHDMKQIWNVNCFNCHATNLDRGFTAATKSTSPPRRAGEAWERVQLELAASLRSFPESAPQQAALAWLHAERGETEAAERAVDAALAVDPALARPHFIRASQGADPCSPYKRKTGGPLRDPPVSV